MTTTATAGRRSRLARAARGAWILPWALLGACILVVALGRFLAPYGASEIVAAPGQAPDGSFLLGTDNLGRDVLSRTLNGGLTVFGLAGTATILAYLIGAAIGLSSGYLGGWPDAVMMRFVDVLMAFPGVVIVLVFIGGLGSSIPILIMGTVLIKVPSIARLTRAAAIDIGSRGFVEAAQARGEGTSAILTHEVLPNMKTLILADLPIRFGYAVAAIASMNYLGVGISPPTADWGLMVAENQVFITLNPWGVVAPALMLALVVCAVSLAGDRAARPTGSAR